MGVYKSNSNIKNASVNNTFLGGVGNHIVALYEDVEDAVISAYDTVTDTVVEAADYVGGKVVSATKATKEFFSEALNNVKNFFALSYDGKETKFLTFHPPKKGEFDIEDYAEENFDVYNAILDDEELDATKKQIESVSGTCCEIQEKVNSFTEIDTSLTEFFKEANQAAPFTEEAYGGIVVPDPLLEEWLEKKDKEYHADWYQNPEMFESEIAELESSRKMRVKNYDHHGIPFELLEEVYRTEFENEAKSYNIDINTPEFQEELQKKIDNRLEFWTERTNELNDKIKNYEAFKKYNEGNVVVQGEQIVDLDSYIYAQMNVPYHKNKVNERLYNAKQYLDLLPYEMISITDDFIEADIDTQFDYTDDYDEILEIIDYYDNLYGPKSSFLSWAKAKGEAMIGKNYEKILKEKYNVNSKEEWETFKKLSFLTEEERKMYFYLKAENEEIAQQFMIAHEDQVNQQIGGLKTLNEMQRYGMIELDEVVISARIKAALKLNPNANVDELRKMYKYDFSCYKLKDANAGRAVLDYAASLGFGVRDGIIQFDEGIKNLFAADGIKSSEDYQRMYLAQMLSTGEGGLWLLDETYQFGTGVGQMLPVVVISAATSGIASGLGFSEATAAQAAQIAGKVALTASAFGNTKEQVYQNYECSRTQAYLYAAASAGIELYTEQMGSISPIASENPRNFLEAFINEAKEEALGSIMNAELDAVFMGEDFDGVEVLEQAFVEGLYGGFVGETFYGFNALKTMKKAKQLGMSYKDMHNLMLEYAELDNPSKEKFAEMVVQKKESSLTHEQLVELKNNFMSSPESKFMTYEEYMMNLNLKSYLAQINKGSSVSNTTIETVSTETVMAETTTSESQETVMEEQKVDDVIPEVADLNVDNVDNTSKPKISQEQFIKQFRKKYPKAKYNVDYHVVKNSDGTFCVVWDDYQKYKASTSEIIKEIYNNSSDEVKRCFEAYTSEYEYNSYSTLNALLRGNLFVFNEDGKIEAVNMKNIYKKSSQIDILEFIKNSDYESLEEFIELQKQELTTLNEFIRENSIKDPMVTFRGVKASTISTIFGIDETLLQTMSLDEFKKAVMDKGYYQDGGFLSTSVTEDAFPVTKGKYVFEFRNAEGTPAIDLQYFNRIMDEQEVLVAPNVRYIIKDVVSLEDGRFKIILETDPSYSFEEGNQLTTDIIDGINYTNESVPKATDKSIVDNALDDYRMSWGDIKNKGNIINSLNENQQKLFINSLSINECIHLINDGILIDNPETYVEVLNIIVEQGHEKSLDIFSKLSNSPYYMEMINKYGSDALYDYMSNYPKLELDNYQKITDYVDGLDLDNQVEYNLAIEALKQQLLIEIEHSPFNKNSGYYSYMELLDFLDSSSNLDYDDKTKLLVGVINSDESLRQDIYNAATFELSVLKDRFDFDDKDIKRVLDLLLGKNFVASGIVNEDLKWDTFTNILEKYIEPLVAKETKTGKEPVLWGTFPDETHDLLDDKYITVSNTSIGGIGFFEGIFTSWYGNENNLSVKDFWTKLSSLYVESACNNITDGKIKYLYPDGMDVTDSFGEIFKETELATLIFNGNVDKIVLVETNPQSMEEISSLEIDISDLIEEMDDDYAKSNMNDDFLQDKELCRKYFDKFLDKVKEVMVNE